MSLFFKRAFNVIPEELYGPIVSIVDKAKDSLKNSTSIKKEYLQYLFDVYNAYLSGSVVEDINCSGCVTRVWGKMRMLRDEIVNRGLIEAD